MNGNLSGQFGYSRPASAYPALGANTPMADPGTTGNPQDRIMYENFRTGGRAIPQSLARYNMGSSTAVPQVSPVVQPAQAHYGLVA